MDESCACAVEAGKHMNKRRIVELAATDGRRAASSRFTRARS
jgi:hypothetical protein